MFRNLTSQEGGFYTAEDADSEGEEGKFYLWTEEDIRKALSPEDADLALRVFGIKTEGNYDESAQTRNGKNILHLSRPLDEVASELNISLGDLIHRLGRIRKLLFETREKRVRPNKDNKILTDWNGLMIAALARASQVFNKSQYLKDAVKASKFILEKMKGEDGKLYHRYAIGEKAVDGFLDDYAFLAWGLIEIYEACFENEYLQSALELTKTMIVRFWDEKYGGFYYTTKDTKNTWARIKEANDGALPSGNSVALLNLLRLALLTGELTFENMASQIIKVFSEEVKRAPTAYTFMLLGVNFVLGPIYNVVLVGNTREGSTQDMLTVLRVYYMPNMVVSLRQPNVTGLDYKKIEGKATAYVCRNQTCMPPTNKVEKLLEFLEIH